jgi:hypothetical protein
MRVYFVIWQPTAAVQLESAFLGASNPQSVLDAAMRIDEQLAVDPFEVGESREPTVRLVIELPLQALISIDAAAKTVYVDRVALLDRGRR